MIIINLDKSHTDMAVTGMVQQLTHWPATSRVGSPWVQILLTHSVRSLQFYESLIIAFKRTEFVLAIAMLV